MTLNAEQERLCPANETDFSDLAAVLVNTSIKRDAGASNIGLLLSVPAEIMRRAGARAEEIHLLDHRVPPGVQPDMTVGRGPPAATRSTGGVWASTTTSPSATRRSWRGTAFTSRGS